MKRYNLLNNVFGWVSFLIAAVVYLMTIEPTSSFWDCGEFILSAHKLEVGHPPGAPFFMLTAKLFSLFASDLTEVAKMVNSMSALLSALTILFLFWTITHLVKKLVYTNTQEEISLGQIIAILGSGLVGALVYTFSDTFWFSAVEAEVYAYSSMFTALVFWLILKWESRANEPGSDKWLILIAYAMGLSIGVHLLNLLCIPAIVLVYYFKKNEKPSLKGILLALMGSFALIVILMYGIIPGFTKVGGWFELLFVNQLGLSYNSGVLFYMVLLFATIAWGLYETLSPKGDLKRAKISFLLSIAFAGITFISDTVFLWIVLIGVAVAICLFVSKVNFRFLNTALLCLLVILVGYSSFALIPIRSMANTPMDQNSPEHVFSLAAYLNREQYGDRPLIYGKTYASHEVREQGRLKEPVSTKKIYDKAIKKTATENDKYIVANTIPEYEVNNKMLFPRMYSKEDKHLLGYSMWGDMESPNVRPTMLQNLQFFFSYQLNYMYFRYFMWNFSGRQNDIAGNGSISNGNWITGIGFIDQLLGNGPQDNLPPDMVDNKGHNAYFALPFLLGILGILFQIRSKEEGEKQFLITFVLFFMTGIAIILYLNQQPFEPRERDYAYAGSFYAFCIWVGIGVAFLWRLAKKIIPEAPAAALVTAVALIVPIQMAAQNWDDHDRSGRYTMRNFAKNYLDTCEPNAILFTMGDNDTFPLWYMQEVEGYRTDVRVCNLSYLQTGWYIDQMRRDAYDSPALPITWTEDQYKGEKATGASIITRKDMEQHIIQQMQSENEDLSKWGVQIDFNKFFDTSAFKDEVNLDEALKMMKEKVVPRNMYTTQGMLATSTIFSAPVDESAIDWSKLKSKPQSEFIINIGDNKGYLAPQEIMLMEMLNNINKDGWKRPIYYASTIGQPPLNLHNSSITVGINQRIVPGEIDETGVDVDATFDNLVNKYHWEGLADPNIYLDENNLRMCRTSRLLFSSLIGALLEKEDNARALQALDKCVAVLPGNTVPRGMESVPYVSGYYTLGEVEKGEAVAQEILARANGSLQWYSRLGRRDTAYSSSDIKEFLDTKVRILSVYQRYDNERYEAMFTELLHEVDVFLSNGAVFRQDPQHPLGMMMQVAFQRVYQEKEEAKKEEAMNSVRTIGSLMQKYTPELLKKYIGE